MSDSKIKRRVWQCPLCERRYKIPASAKDPKLCPQCKKADVEPPTGVPNDTTGSMRKVSTPAPSSTPATLPLPTPVPQSFGCLHQPTQPDSQHGKRPCNYSVL